ncbi:hypothetical protein BDR03DRAFT_980352 [Suillus americanus]|nr:hypothetical protein BDR03DRAFT_980352 [Suillus americanus]
MRIGHMRQPKPPWPKQRPDLHQSLSACFKTQVPDTPRHATPESRVQTDIPFPEEQGAGFFPARLELQLDNSRYTILRKLGRGEFPSTRNIWTLGCMTFELLTGSSLFNPHAGQTWSIEDEHLVKTVQMTGESFSEKILAKSRKRNEYFDESGLLMGM